MTSSASKCTALTPEQCEQLAMHANAILAILQYPSQTAADAAALAEMDKYKERRDLLHCILRRTARSLTAAALAAETGLAAGTINNILYKCERLFGMASSDSPVQWYAK